MDAENEVIEKLTFLFSPGQVIELRIPKSKSGPISGYFNDFNRLVQEAVKFDEKVPGIYVTLNPINPDLLYRAKNKLRYGREAQPTTSDNDIKEYSWLPLDFDPVRPSDISSSDEEHEAALTKAQEVREWLTSQGWVPPIFSDSGNGGHLLYPVKLPNDQESRRLIDKCLKALDLLFSDEVVKIDTKVGNPGRIWKLYGTMSCKGENSPERPWRRSRVIEAPKQLIPVPRALLEKLTALLPEVPRGNFNESVDIERWLEKHSLKVSKIKPWDGGNLYELEECPWNPEHKKTAYIVQFPDGGIAAKCFHNSCSEQNWFTLRDKVEPGWRKNQIEEAVEIRFTEGWVSRRFVVEHGENVRYCYSLKKWFVWNGKNWELDETGELARLVKQTIRGLYQEALNVQEEEPRRAFIKFVAGCDRNDKLGSIIALARSECPIKANEFDRNDWLLNVQNGTVDLRTGELLPHRKEDFHSKICPVSYDPGAKSELWNRFLTRILPDDEVREYIQKISGYSICGDTGAEKLFFPFGPPASGKSTFLRSIQYALGDYAATADFEAFLHRDKVTGSPRDDIARLVGKRLVISLEVDDGRRLASAMVKAITGGDRIAARRLYQESVEFIPKFKLWLAANNRPRVSDDDLGLWRRIEQIGFNVEIPEREQDPELKAKLEGEAAGILTWLVEGCLKYQREGLKIPGAVKAITDEYRQSMNPIKDFLDEECYINPGVSIKKGELFEAYMNYCRVGGQRYFLGKRQFGERIRKQFEEQKTRDGHYWIGICLSGEEHSPRCDKWGNSQISFSEGKKQQKRDLVTNVSIKSSHENNQLDFMELNVTKSHKVTEPDNPGEVSAVDSQPDMSIKPLSDDAGIIPMIKTPLVNPPADTPKVQPPALPVSDSAPAPPAGDPVPKEQEELTI